METVYGTMKDLLRYIRRKDDEGKWSYTNQAVLLRSLKTNLPLGAFATDGSSGGTIYSRRNVLKLGGPYHRFNNSDKAYNILLTSVLKAKGEQK